MVWLPIGSDVVVKVAALPLTFEVPRTVAPSEKVTVPVTLEDRVAVKVTDCSACAGFSEEARVIVGEAFETTCVVVPVAVLLLLSPLYVAVIVPVPTGSTVVETVAAPEPLTVPVPSGVVPLVKTTVPVTLAGSCAVTVTDEP